MPRIRYDNKRLQQKKLDLIYQASEILEEYAEQGYTLTLRQLYYQFVARDLLPNVAKSYDTLGSAVNDGRMAGLIDWDHIVDRTRELKDNPHFEDPADAITSISGWYAIDKWKTQSIRPEVWIEKDALLGVIEPVCRRLDVSFFSCRGYTSQSEMWAAANRLREYIEAGQQVVILHLGDHDPSGIDMTRDIDDRLWTFVSGDYGRTHPEYSDVNVELTIQSALTVKRIALTMEQIEQYNPPPNPAKVTDSRAGQYIAEYGDSSWELDALTPEVMSDLITAEVDALTNWDLYEAAQDQERTDKDDLKVVATNWAGAVAHAQRKGRA